MKTLVISSMKDEGPYLLEWIAHHRAIGFSDFLIYTNDCTDGTDHLLDRLAERGIVTHKRTKVLKRGPQKSAFKDAITTEEYSSADWVYVTDADEFLCIKAGAGQVSDLIAAYDVADVIPVTWRHFSTSGDVAVNPSLICDRYQDAEPAQATDLRAGRFVKSLFKPSKNIEGLGLHAPKIIKGKENKFSWGSAEWLEDPNANPTRPKSSFGYEVAQVNHYPLKSVDAYLMKRRRGRANHFNETLGTEYWDRWNLGGEKDRSISETAKLRAKEMELLLEDGLTAHLHQAAVSLTVQAFQVYVKEPVIGALRAGLIVKSEQMNMAKPPKAMVAPKVRNKIVTEPAAKKPANTSEKKKGEGKAGKNANGKAKRFANRSKLLGDMPKNGRCAEIGVWNGDFSTQILEIAEPAELTLIDPWGLLAEGPSTDWNHKKHGSSDAMDTMFQHVQSKFEGEDRINICKGFSEDILNRYPDDYFDWVYIDGNHQYEFVKADVELCFRKVRNGGVIAGDDFFWERSGRRHVRDAVIDVLKEKDIDAKTSLSRYGQQFMISVVKKSAAEAA
ncbi:glycosyltransferase family 2 protein [Rhodobacteraceae bacterium]|nr:glycosyltransferase family 2 protein [Paracoccaceae bacterium]